jgi:prevent-host-death family protein
MHVVDIHAAANDLEQLIDRALTGEEIVITRDGVPVVKLEPVQVELPRRQRGSLEGRVIVPDSFFAPLPERELAGWEDEVPRVP